MKKIFRTIHLYLGLASGLVIMVSCLTGAILVFEREWQSVLYPERYFVKPLPNAKLLQESIKAVQHVVPGSNITSIKVYSDPTRSIEITYSEIKKEEEKKPEGLKTEGEKKKPEAGKGPGRLQAYTNPYTGDLISLYNHRSTFFYTVFGLHRWLLSGDIGKLITGISTLIFVFILITGIILWWPKTKEKLKHHLTIKWRAKWKRVNHDLHIVIGFYSSIILFVSAFTALAWSFEWFNEGIYLVTGTENKRHEAPKSVAGSDTVAITFDDAFRIIKAEVPSAQFYTLNKAKERNGSFEISVLPKDSKYENTTDQYFLDQYTGEVIHTISYERKNSGQRVKTMFYNLHVGAIGGIPTKIIWMLACLAGVTFPVTGVIIWGNRVRKRTRKNVKKSRKNSLLLDN
jgi:uncharacterized iron-regulated membrane protein